MEIKVDSTVITTVDMLIIKGGKKLFLLGKSVVGAYQVNIIQIFRSRSPFYAYSMREKQRQIEERRVIYVGRIEEGMTSAKLRKRFSIFGPIIDISLHFREYG